MISSKDLQWEKYEHSSAFIFYWFVFILEGNKTNHNSWMSLNFDKISSMTSEISGL